MKPCVHKCADCNDYIFIFVVYTNHKNMNHKNTFRIKIPGVWYNTGRIVSLQQSKGLVPRESACNHNKVFNFKESAQQQVKCCASLSSLKTYHDIFLSASLLCRLLDHFRHGFQGRLLPTCDFEKQVSPASLTLSVSPAAPIAYWIWVLEVIGTVKQIGVWLVRQSHKFVSISKANAAFWEQT